MVLFGERSLHHTLSEYQYLRQMEKMSKNGVKAKNQLIDFIGLSKRHFCQKWLKIQIGEGIEYMTHYRTERPHQGKGKGNVILFPSAKAKPDLDSPIACRKRLGGLLNYYHRKTA